MWLSTKRPLLNLVEYGEITNSSQFMFQNCINKQLLVWEEPLIGHTEIEKCKLVFEGSTTEDSIKYRGPYRMRRTTVLITTNHPLWRHCTSEEQAFINRSYVYNLWTTCLTDAVVDATSNLISVSAASARILEQSVNLIGQTSYAHLVNQQEQTKHSLYIGLCVDKWGDFCNWQCQQTTACLLSTSQQLLANTNKKMSQ